MLMDVVIDALRSYKNGLIDLDDARDMIMVEATNFKRDALNTDEEVEDGE
jgi:hypothetical protein